MRIVGGIYDYLGESTDPYVLKYERIARDFVCRVSAETKEVCELVKENVRPGDLVLDLGCGNGYILNSLAGIAGTAVDVSLLNLMMVMKEYTRVRDRIEQFDPTHRYGTIICTDVLEHVEDPYPVISRIFSLLDSGGVLLTAFPWEQDLSVYQSEAYKPFNKYGGPPHLRSIGYDFVREYFCEFDIRGERMVTSHMDEQALNPYPIKFMRMIKR